MFNWSLILAARFLWWHYAICSPFSIDFLRILNYTQTIKWFNIWWYVWNHFLFNAVNTTLCIHQKPLIWRSLLPKWNTWSIQTMYVLIFQRVHTYWQWWLRVFQEGTILKSEKRNEPFKFGGHLSSLSPGNNQE